MAERLGVTVWIVFSLGKITLNGSVILPKAFTDRNAAVEYQEEINGTISKVHGKNAAALDYYLHIVEQDI